MTNLTLALRAVTAGYDKQAPVLENLDVDFLQPELNYLVGASGSGKTTLLHLLAGVLTPFSGTLVRTPQVRPQLVLQFPEQLFLADTVSEELAMLSHDSLANARSNMKSLGLDYASVGARSHRSLSFAERRLLAISIQSANATSFLLLDEPTLGLDDEHLHNIASWLNAQVQADLLCVVVTHDPDLLVSAPGRIHLLEHAHITWSGESAEFLLSETLKRRAGFIA